MALLDMSVATQVLLRLFDLTIDNNWAPSAAAPDFESTDRLLNVHLFHIREEAHRKNFPPPFEGDAVPVRLTPLGLALFYVVTPAVKAEGDDATIISNLALERQLVLGQAAKAVHDFPLIDKTTRVNGTLIVDGALVDPFGNNRIELILRPAGVDEAVTFWSSGQTQTPPHPSLYLEARVILLQPEEPETFTGLVLSVGNFIFVGFPQLVRSRSTLLVTPPGATQPIPLQASPARVALFAGSTPAGVAPDNNRLVLEGADLSPRLRLLTLSGPNGLRVTINLDDSTDNPAWAPELSGTAIAVHVHRTAIEHDGGATVLLVPGAYTARIVLVDEAAPPSIQPRTSNSVPFSVIPQLHNLTLVATGVGTLTYTVSVPGGFLDDLDETLVVQFGVGGTVFEKVASAPAVGQFAYDNTSTIRFTITDPDPDPGDPPVQLPVLLVVNEATAMPVWVVVVP